ncbi:MAG: fumarylacetoacetate hydrolase family protein [Flavobacteriaceae bacterium]|nr:fumarylacetoacetate hydrolase family protein [Flavobacteriaceae bacterium]
MKIICVGRNYPDHIEELQNNKPSKPVLFIKPDSAVLQRKSQFVIPHFTNHIHYEVELAIGFNALGKHIQPQFACKYFNRVTLGIDFTARDLQNQLKKQGLPWEKAKGFDRSALIGKWIEKKEFENIQNLEFCLLKNDKIVQQANTSKMIWTIDQLISYVSSYFTIKIGDVLFTGTPKGVGPVVSGDILVGVLACREVFKVHVK